MTSIKVLNRIMVLSVLALLGCASAQGRSETAHETITINLAGAGHNVMGFGAHVWTGDLSVRPVLKSLGLRYARMTVGPNWFDVARQPPVDATRDAIDRFLAEHFDGDHEPRLGNAKATWRMLDELGITVIMIQFSAPDNYLSRDGQRRLLPKHVDDYARYWGSLVAFMDSHGMRPPYIELVNEPEGDWNTRILPEDYNKLAILTRRELDERGFEDVQILGPGLAYLDHDDGGKRWIGALTDEGVQALGGWSSHTWDETFKLDAPIRFMAGRWRDFKAAIRRQDPTGSKPIFITEYATAARTFNGVTYNAVESNQGNRASDSSAYAQRVFEQTLLHINQGASVLIVWEAADQPWSHHAWGLVTSEEDGSRPRPVYHALTTLLPFIPSDAIALAPLEQDHVITATGFRSDGLLTVALANGSDLTRGVTLVIQNAPGLDPIEFIRFHNGEVETFESKPSGGLTEFTLPPESTLTCRFRLTESEPPKRD